MSKQKDNEIPAKPRKESHLHIRVLAESKALWEAAAARAGVDLTRWVEHHLDAAAAKLKD